uniref:Transforming acidic coiled-coil-containing protein C-terminal domain-containing protein n=1 Tax=Panagrolaimus superbus TaxID=310955 RepID=A0A914YLR4_9BILA
MQQNAKAPLLQVVLLSFLSAIGIQYFQQESQRATDVIKVVNDRYRDLLSDAEKNISEANEKMNEMQTQHDKDTVTMRYKLLQQEVKLKSLNSQIVTLQTERLELMNMPTFF